MNGKKRSQKQNHTFILILFVYVTSWKNQQTKHETKFVSILREKKTNFHRLCDEMKKGNFCTKSYLISLLFSISLFSYIEIQNKNLINNCVRKMFFSSKFMLCLWIQKVIIKKGWFQQGYFNLFVLYKKNIAFIFYFYYELIKAFDKKKTIT